MLILDFGGVCTFTAAEVIALELEPSDLASSVRPEAEAVVQAAKAAGSQVAILSNELSVEWVGRVPLLQQVDYVVCCSDNGIYKPDRRAFQRCLLLSGAEAEKTLVVDDEADNVTVAASLGMTAVPFESALEDPWKQVKELLDV